MLEALDVVEYIGTGNRVRFISQALGKWQPRLGDIGAFQNQRDRTVASGLEAQP